MSDRSRREIVKSLVWAAGASVALPWVVSTEAAEAGHLDVKDPAAAAQGYVEDAGQVDRKKYPSFAPGSSCENCLLLQGTAGNNYRPCSLFPGKLVSVSGWCKGWTAEM
jgi:high potential iron-sulfur protein